MMKALIANKKSPKVKTVIGKVRSVSKGFTMVFKNAKTIATKTADKKSSTLTPGNILATKNTAKAEVIIFKRKFMLQI